MVRVPDAVLVGPAEGESIMVGAIPTTFKGLAVWSEGAFHIVEQPIAPGMLVPPHRHTYEDQLAYVIEGTIGFRVGEQEFEAVEGAFAYRRRGIVHTNWNATNEPARMLEISSPGGFEEYFRKVGILTDRGDAGPAELAELAAEYGITFHLELAEHLEARHGVRLP